MTKSLYIHIPFCGNICWFCNFKRIKTNEYNIIENYIKKIIIQLENESIKKQYKTIYIGGGTPNYLPENLLTLLLSSINNFIDFNDYEFSIECNPEYINESQIKIFKKFNVNRISLGVQSLNHDILKKMNRHHDNKQVENAINLFYKYNIENVSLDFIYNYPDMTFFDIDEVFNFVIKNKIKHVSFYSLEIKDNSILKKNNYKIDENNEEKQLLYIIDKFKKNNYKRYEISNWCLSKKYESKHNKVYWNFEDWKAIGFGAHGHENNILYFYEGNVQNFKKYEEKLTTEEVYQNILMMGLRKTEGIDLSFQKNSLAFNFYKNKLKQYIIVDNKIKAINIDCLNDVIIDIF